LRNYGVAVAEQHFLKSCGIAIAEVLPSSCGIAMADSKKSCACPPLSKPVSLIAKPEHGGYSKTGGRHVAYNMVPQLECAVHKALK
jgi:hypothetical protein